MLVCQFVLLPNTLKIGLVTYNVDLLFVSRSKEISLNSDESDREDSTELNNTEPGPEQPLLCDPKYASFKPYYYETSLC